MESGNNIDNIESIGVKPATVRGVIEQRNFLIAEFGLTDLVTVGPDKLREIRERCFDIEVHESMQSEDGDGELSLRGQIAVEFVDILLPLIKERKTVKTHESLYAAANAV